LFTLKVHCFCFR